MEKIKTSIEKIFDDFSENVSHVIPKRLSFDLNTSAEGQAAKKRKHSDAESTADQSTNDTSSNTSLNNSVFSSPWEARRMRVDLIEAKARVTQLRREIKNQNIIQANLELKYSEKVSALEKEVVQSTKKVGDLDKHVKVLRKRENAAKEELVKTKNQLNLQKQEYDDRIFQLEKQNQDVKAHFRKNQNDLLNDLQEQTRLAEELAQNLNTVQEEHQQLVELTESWKEKAEQFDRTANELEASQHQLATAQSKIKELEYEVASYGDWKNLSKASQSRLIAASDAEKELIKLRQDTKNLRDSLGNKLLLEEQVNDYKIRLEKFEQNHTDAVALQVRLEAVELELHEWKQIAHDHCKTPVATPQALRTSIEKLLQNDLVLTSEKGSVRNEKSALESQMAELKQQNEVHAKQTDDLRRSLKQHQTILHRVQKKLQLVARERDFFKQLLDSYEKDLTITSSSSLSNPDSTARNRIDMLEKTVTGYKELCAKMELELQQMKAMPDFTVDVTLNSEQYERLRRELNLLRLENEKVHKKKEELELELENCRLRGAASLDAGVVVSKPAKVLHLTQNPSTQAYEQHQTDVVKLQAEIERLKRRNRKLEEGNSDLTMRLNDTNMTMNVKDVNSLRVQVQTLEAKNQHLKEIYKAASQEFREVCYMLFGYKVDRIGNTNYRISSMYAECEEDYLNFRLNDAGVLDMLETDYSVSLEEMMRTQLATHNSLPAFLSALTLELLNKSTITVTC